MAYHYFCPSCSTELNPHQDVVLTGGKGKKRGLVLLNPEPGNYQAHVAKVLGLKAGDKVDFACPICQATLRSPVDKNLVQLSFKSDLGDEGFVTFSRVYGEHATYFIENGKVRSFGENAALYGDINFFGEGDRE
jgi:hypothetical protein